MKHKQITDLFVRSNLSAKNAWPEFNPDADCDWITKKSQLPWLKLMLDVPTDQILEEIKNAQHLLVEHRDDYGENRGWKSFCIHGKSLTETQHRDDLRPFHWIPEVESLMPTTVKFLKGLDIGTYQRVRVMALEPKGYVHLHRDLNPQEKEKFHRELAPINISITQPENCDFIIKDWGTIPFRPGDAYMPCISKWHAVINDSDEIRYHIIIHSSDWTDSFRSLVEKSYRTMLAKNPS
jgi:hypothetical protein